MSNAKVHAVDMHKTDLDGKELTSYKLQKDLRFHFDN
ncbi:choloylglycine hydrolase [Lactobacillus crispatus]|jgi:choloylglycine hydrolase|nr:choloylglycine hydrolase [Lactobacillus crispatus]TDN18081.1 choloylglycine hydrolase [Lactobacillus crispatus]TDN30577.1 choloylglycine hydrolase [Lactobacillus crispatus]